MALFDTPEKIMKAVNDSEGDQDLLRMRMEEHFDYAVGKEYTTANGYSAYTSTSPQTFFEKITDGLNRAEISLRIRLDENAKEKERREASVAELFLFGALDEIDRNLARRGQPPLREGLGMYISARGWYTLKCLVYVKNEETYFDVQPWDPMHVTYGYGSDGLLWIAHSRMEKTEVIEADYGIKKRGREAKIIDFWDREANSVLIGNSEFLKYPEEHNLKEIPVLHGAVGSMPTVQEKDHGSTLEYRGNSIFHSAIHTFQPFNQFVSELMDIQKKSITGSLMHKSKTGQKKLKGDPYQEYMEIQLSEDEDISPLVLPVVPEVTQFLMAILDTEKQQSMLPYPLAYGGTQEPLSGRALAQLADATRSVYSPRTGAASRCYVWLCEQLLAQYAQKGLPTTFQGYKPDGKYFKVKVKPTQVKQGWFISVEVSPKLPRDLEQDVQTARMAVTPLGQNGERLMSFQTAREDILEMRDPDAERDRTLAEYGESLPPVVIQNVAAALARRGQDEIAGQVLALQQPAPGGPPGAGGPPGPGGPGPGGPGGGPPGAGGPLPELPPEMINAIAQVFIQAGQEELGLAVLELLGVPLAPPGAPPPGAPPPASPNGVAVAPGTPFP